MAVRRMSASAHLELLSYGVAAGPKELDHTSGLGRTCSSEQGAPNGAWLEKFLMLR